MVNWTVSRPGRVTTLMRAKAAAGDSRRAQRHSPTHLAGPAGAVWCGGKSHSNPA